MKITDTLRYLTLAIDSLERVLMPELVSPDAKATAEIMRQVLHELVKRERFSPRLLDEQIAEGKVLAAGMAALLGELTGRLEEDLAPAAPHRGDFKSLSAAHTALTERIALLAGALVSQRGTMTDLTQQEYLSTLLHKAASWEATYYNDQRSASGTGEAFSAHTSGGPLTLELVQDFLRTRHPAGALITVTAFAPIPGGFGKQTYRCTISTGTETPDHLIVRKSDPVPMIEFGGFFVDQEFHLLQSVFATGFPVAEPLFLGSKVAGVDADFYIMKAIPGTVPSSFLGAATAVVPESVVLNMAELLARLHNLKLESFANYLEQQGQSEILSDTVESCYRRCIREWKAYFERVEHLPSPFLIYMFDWLEQHVPADLKRPVLVHGDFNIHNVLAEDGRITAVLDWECAMFGAPEQDLAYIKPIISKHIGWDRFLAHYHAAGGPEINEQTLSFYMAFSALRVSVIFNRGIRNLQHGKARDIRFSVVEQGLTSEFMNLALASTSKV